MSYQTGQHFRRSGILNHGINIPRNIISWGGCQIFGFLVREMNRLVDTMVRVTASWCLRFNRVTYIPIFNAP